MAILEHLKVRDDDRDGPQEPRAPETSTSNTRPRGDAGSRYVR